MFLFCLSFFVVFVLPCWFCDWLVCYLANTLIKTYLIIIIIITFIKINHVAILNVCVYYIQQGVSKFDVREINMWCQYPNEL